MHKYLIYNSNVIDIIDTKYIYKYLIYKNQLYNNIVLTKLI